MKRKSNNVVMLLTGLAALALTTIGFSSFITGIQRKSDDTNNINVSVKATTNESITIDMKTLSTNNSITLSSATLDAEKEPIESPNGGTIDGSFIESDTNADLDILVETKIEITKDYLVKNQSFFEDFKLVYSLNTSNFFDTTVNYVGRTGVGPWSYVNKPVDYLFKGKGFTVSTDGTLNYQKPVNEKSSWNIALEGTNIYKLSSNLLVEFNWGSYFNNMNPVDYYKQSEVFTACKNSYNSNHPLYKDLHEWGENGAGVYTGLIASELNAMNKKFPQTGDTSLKINVNLTK